MSRKKHFQATSLKKHFQATSLKKRFTFTESRWCEQHSKQSILSRGEPLWHVTNGHNRTRHRNGHRLLFLRTRVRILLCTSPTFDLHAAPTPLSSLPAASLPSTCRALHFLDMPSPSSALCTPRRHPRPRAWPLTAPGHLPSIEPKHNAAEGGRVSESPAHPRPSSTPCRLAASVLLFKNTKGKVAGRLVSDGKSDPTLWPVGHCQFRLLIHLEHAHCLHNTHKRLCPTRSAFVFLRTGGGGIFVAL